MEEINQKLTKLMEMKNEIEEIKSLCKSTNTAVQSLSNDVEDLKRDNEATKSDINLLASENEELRVKVNELTQYSMKNNLIFQGIPYKDEESVREVIMRIAEVLEVKIENYHIAAAHRLPARAGKEAIPIIVKFNDNDIKSAILSKAKIMKPKGSDIGFESSLPVYVDEHLTKETLKLWLTAKNMVKNGVIFNATCREGKIKIRRTESSNPMRVVSISQLERFNHVSDMDSEQEVWNEGRSNGTKRSVEIRSPENNDQKGVEGSGSQRKKSQRQFIKPNIRGTEAIVTKLQRFKNDKIVKN